MTVIEADKSYPREQSMQSPEFNPEENMKSIAQRDVPIDDQRGSGTYLSERLHRSGGMLSCRGLRHFMIEETAVEPTAKGSQPDTTRRPSPL